MLNPLAIYLLWGGNEKSRKIPKVASKTCVLPKDKGGLALLDVLRLVDKLASKWIIRSTNNKDYGVVLVKGKCKNFHIKERKAREVSRLPIYFYLKLILSPRDLYP